jgi:hypothetical protein
MGGKLGRLLEATLKKMASQDSSAPVELVLVPHRQEDMNALVQELQSLGGTPIEVGPESVYCQVPASEVQRLSESELVSEIRPARIHKMH